MTGPCPCCNGTGLLDVWGSVDGWCTYHASNDPDAPDDPDWQEYCHCSAGVAREKSEERSTPP